MRFYFNHFARTLLLFPPSSIEQVPVTGQTWRSQHGSKQQGLAPKKPLRTRLLSTQTSATTKMKTLVAATLLALCLLPATTQAGATFDEALPSFTQANNYKMVFNSGTTSSAAANNTKRPVATNNAGHSPFENATLNMRVVNVEPCGVIAAHIHPRATEHLYMMKGSVEVGMFVESGNAVYVTPKEGEGVVIPQGTVHYVRNVGCRVSQYVVALDDPNPGVLFVGQALVGFPRSVIDNAFDGKFPMASKGNQYLLSKPYCNCK